MGLEEVQQNALSVKITATPKICLGVEFFISCAPSPAMARKHGLAGDVFIRVVHRCENQSKAMSQPASLKAGCVKPVVLCTEWEKL